MSKATEKLQLQLSDLAEAINAFRSESVQLKVTERVLYHFLHLNSQEHTEETPAQETPIPEAPSRAPGPSRILDQLLKTDYFKRPRSLPDITAYINQQTGNAFYTHQISGVLLGFVRKQKLSRIMDEFSNSFLYQL